MSFEVGQRVETEKNGKGKVAFVGATQFAEGEWIGVILDEPKGKNNGSVNGEVYFSCEQNYGLFIRPTQLKVESARGKPPSSGLKTPSANLRKDSVHGSSSKLSTGSSPAMSPTASRENLSRMTQSGAKKSIGGGVPSSSTKVAQKGKESGMKVEWSEEKEKKRSPPTTPDTPNVLSRVKKMEEDGSVANSTIPSVAAVSVPPGMDESTELEYMRVQVKDLSEKLETLRLKRKEDREKLVEYERMKVQLHGLVEYKNKAQEVRLELERKMREKEQELDGLREWKESKSEELRNFNEDMELLTLDKEMAEEKAEQLQDMVDELKSKVDELEVNLAILREEMEIGGGGGNGEGNSVQMKQIMSQNERLREALIKLRDANGNALEEKIYAEKELEKLKSENGELLRMGQIWRKKTEESEEAIMNLKEQVDAYLASEEVIQHLTDKNLDMEEKIRALELDKEDLEVMRDMDEQIAEEQKEVEKTLRADIEAMQVSINELLLRQRQEEDHSEQLSETIIKFRKKTAELNGEMEDLKDQILHLEKEVSEGREDEKDRAGQASLALINTARQFSIMVEWRTRGVEMQYGEKHVKYLKAFLPDNFTKYPQVPGGMRVEHVTKSHKGEQWAQVGKAGHICAAIYNVCGQIESGLSTCTVDRLSSIAHLNSDFTLQEKHLDNYIDLLKNGRMDENSSLDYLESCYRYLSKRIMDDQLAGRDSFDALTWLSRSCQSLLSSIEWAAVNESRLGFIVTVD
ncbi:hypothetical protein PMAYCL1PPCAC_18126, partial [Pristionchus mayeri]